MLLIAFFAATIIFQNVNLKNYYGVKIQKEDALVQSFTGQLGLLEEDNQSTPTSTLEEEEEDLKPESFFPASKYVECLVLLHLVLQEQRFSEHHLEITCPPPRS